MLKISWKESLFIYDGTEKFPDFVVEGIIVGDDVQLSCSGGAVEASDVAYTAAIIGITGEKAANYELPSSGLTCEYTIKKAVQNVSNQEETKKEVQKKEKQVAIEKAVYEKEGTAEIGIAKVAPTGDNSMVGFYMVLALSMLVLMVSMIVPVTIKKV